MSEFATTASLEIAVEQSSLSSARSTIEAEFEDISVGVSPDSSGVTADSLSQEPAAAATDGGQSVTDLLAEQLEVLEDIESGLDSGVGGARDRSAVLPLVGAGALGGLIAGGAAGGALTPGLFGRGGAFEEGEAIGGSMQPISEIAFDIGRELDLPDLSEVTFDDLTDGADRLHDWSANRFGETVDWLHDWTVAPFREVTEELHDWSVAPFREVTEELHDWTVEPFREGTEQLHDWTVEPFRDSVNDLLDWRPTPLSDAVDRLRDWSPPGLGDIVPSTSDFGIETPDASRGAQDALDRLTSAGGENRAQARRPARTDVTITENVQIDPSGLREIDRRLDRAKDDVLREVERRLR